MPGGLQKSLRIVQMNAENLFLFLDKWNGQDLANLSEKEWQALSTASVANKSLRKTRWLAESLLDIDADLILLNEVGGLESLENFNRYFLNSSYEVFLIEGNSDRGIDVGYLVRKTLPYKYLLLTHKSRPLNFLYSHEVGQTTIKTHYFARDCSELRVFVGNSSKPALIFLLVHLKSKLDSAGVDPEGRERRAAELKTLVDIYNENRQEHTGVPIVVAGDFNGSARQDQMEVEFAPLYQNSDLKNVFELLGKTLEDSTTQVQFLRNGQMQILQIDYVFVSPELQAALNKDATFVYRYKSELGLPLPLPQTVDQRMALPSDHFPVVVTFAFPAS